MLDRAGTIQDACPGAEQLLARPWETLTGRPLRTLFAPSSELDEALAAAAGDGPFDGSRELARPLAAGARSVRLALGEAHTAEGEPLLVALVSESGDGARPPDGLRPPFAYVDEVLPGGRARGRLSGAGMGRYLGEPVPAGADPIAHWRSAVHIDDVVRESRHLASSAQGRDATVDYRVIDVQGRTRWVRDASRTRRDADGVLVIFGLVREIPAAAPNGEQAAVVEDRVRAVVESLDDVVYRLELLPDGSVTPAYVSPAASRLLGGEPPDGEALLDVWLAAIHPEDRDAHLAHLARLEQGTADDAEFRVVGLDGRARWVWSRSRARRLPGDRLVLEGVMSDVTRRHDGAPADAPPVSLTRRQREILRLLAEGRRTDDMADALGVTPVTVRNHVAGVLRALGAHSRLEAVAQGRRRGLL